VQKSRHTLFSWS